MKMTLFTTQTHSEIGERTDYNCQICHLYFYDITIDTYNNTAEECADKIIELLDYPEKFTAFRTLWSQRKEENL